MRVEAPVQREILLLWGAHPRVRLWRANSGQGLVPTRNGALRPIKINVTGCPDAIGWTSVPVSRLVELGIRDVAVFTGIEFKSDTGNRSDEQKAFAATLKRMGGLPVLARSVADVDLSLSPFLSPVLK